MQSLRFDHLLAGTAVTLTMALTCYANTSFAQSNAAPPAAVQAPASTAQPTKAGIAADPGAAASKVATPPDLTNSVPAFASAKATALSLADTAIVDKLRELLSGGKFDRILGGSKERGPIEAFYVSRQFAPLWITDGAKNDRAKAAAEFLSHIDADALDPNDYPLPQFKSGAEPEALAEAEIRFTNAILTFTRHAQMGRVHYSRIAADILYNLTKPEPGDVLAKLAGAKDVGQALDSYNPQQPGYKALKAKLAEVRARKNVVAKTRIADGQMLRYVKDKKGKETLMQDSRIPLLRERLGVAGDPSNTTYDKELVDAVTAFQKKSGLRPDGTVGPATLAAINGPNREHDADIISANLERWRWMPRDLGKTHVILNIPDFSLRVMRDGNLVWKTKVVVGKPSQATPIMSAEMKYITVNPTWNVPPSIIENEYLPALQQDSTALERIGLKISQESDGTVRIWQPPGDRNALGRIRFNFPNKFLVYQHDTPDKHLFKHDKRAYSHGCMRVEDPIKYGEVLLSLVLPNEKYSQARLRGMFGPSEININFPTTIPVHLTYQTAFVDDDGKLVIRDDIYGRDALVLAALKGSARRVADIPLDRPRNMSSVPVRLPPGSVGGSSFGFSGPSFFDRLFGGGQSEAPMRPRARVGRAGPPR